jgi:carboxymethylenebutenolidase
MRTYLFRSATEGRYPGLPLYSVIFQVTGPIRRAAAMLASHGFVVAVPEIYHELEPAGPRYDPAAARICYDMVLDLFTRTLNKE